jgi:hypothetical protein
MLMDFWLLLLTDSAFLDDFACFTRGDSSSSREAAKLANSFVVAALRATKGDTKAVALSAASTTKSTDAELVNFILLSQQLQDTLSLFLEVKLSILIEDL